MGDATLLLKLAAERVYQSRAAASEAFCAEHADLAATHTVVRGLEQLKMELFGDHARVGYGTEFFLVPDAEAGGVPLGQSLSPELLVAWRNNHRRREHSAEFYVGAEL